MKCLPLLCLLASVVHGQQLVTQQQADVLYERALDYYDHHNYPSAAETFSRFLKGSSPVDGRRELAAYYTAACALQLGNPDGESLMQDFLDHNPGHPQGTQGGYELAQYYYRAKEYNNAAEQFSKVNFANLDATQQSSGRFAWGYSLFNLRKLPAALEQFNFVKSTVDAFGPASSYYAGFIEYGTGENELALTDLKRAENNASYATVVPILIAGIYNRQQKDAELLGYIEQVQKRDQLTHGDELKLLAAEANFRKKNYTSALEGYAVYAEGRTNVDRGVSYRAGLSAFNLSKWSTAIGYFKGAASDKDSLGLLTSYYLGATYLQVGDRQLALGSFQVARKADDKALQEESSYQVSKILYDLGRSDQAIEEFERYLKQYPDSPHQAEVYELLSAAYINASNYNKAIAHIEAQPRRTPILNKVYQKATFLKGTELFNKDAFSEALAYFDKSVEVPADEKLLAAALLWKGETLSALRQYDPAIGTYQQAVALSPRDQDLMADIRYGLGYAFFSLQQFDKALFHFRELSRMAGSGPKSLDGLIRLGDCYYVTKSYPDAVASYKRAIAFNASDKDYALLQAGVIEGIQRQYDAAISDLDNVIRNYPQSAHWDEAVYQRGQLDFGRGNYSQAASSFSRLLGTGRPSRFVPLAHLRRAASYFNLKEYSKTADDYIAVLDKYPAVAAEQDVLLPLQEALNLASRSGEFDALLSKFKSINPNAKGVESVEFEAAKNSYFSQDYAKAESGFGNYLASYPESPRVTEAQYYLAETFYRKKDYPKSLAGYQSLAATTGFQFYNKVLGRLGELEMKSNHPEAAAKAYASLASIAATKKELYTSWTGLMESYFLLAQHDSSSLYAHKLADQSSGSIQNRAYLYLGKNAMARGDYEAAKDEFLATVNVANDEFGAEAKYRLAEIFYLNKEHKQCYETLISLNKDYQAYPEWVGRSFLLLADDYAATGDVFQARATLKSLDKFPLATIKDEAAAKLKLLDEQERQRKVQTPKDTTDQR